MKKGMLKRLSAVGLAAVMAVSLVPVMGQVTNGTVGQVEAKADTITSGDYEYEINRDGSITITKYTGNATTLIIPKTLDGYTIKYIGDWAFAYCSNLNSVSIPEGVIDIGNFAFFVCDNLINVSIPEGVTNIGGNAFCSCSNLANITIPSSVTYIGVSALAECTSLTGITIPSGVTNIGTNAFYKCTNLEDVILMDGVMDIGNGAFCDCSSLTSITVPSTVEGIGDETFSGCISLTDVIIMEGVNYIGEKAFKDCKNLTNITIPDGVNSIENYAFQNCSGLNNITIPSSVSSIGSCAFENCTNLTEVKEMNGVISIESLAFKHCTSLESITIPDSVMRIEWAAFSGCSSLESIIIPSGVASIEEEVFSYCSKLTDVIIMEGNTEIGKNAFSSCHSLRNIVIPNSTKSIGDGAFEQCTSLTSIAIPSSVTNIGEGAFCDCSSLTSITIPSSVTNIGGYAFSNCRSLTSITIPSSLSSIDKGVFYCCDSLSSVIMTSSITNIGENAFAFCEKIADVYYNGSEEEWNAITIGDWNEYLTNATIHYNSSGSGEGGDEEYNITERTVDINYTGYPQGYFYLCDSFGEPLKNTSFSFTITEPNSDGENNIYTYENRNTDANGGYQFAPPHPYTYSSGSSNVFTYVIDITSVNGDTPNLLHDSFTVNVNVKNIEYTETWKFGLTTSLNHDVTKYGEITASAGGVGIIKLKHNADYTEDLTLSVKLPTSTTATFKKPGVGLDDYAIKIASVKGALKNELYETYSTEIKDFDPLNKEHREILASYLYIIFNETMSNNILVRQAMKTIGYEDRFIKCFDESASGTEVSLKANGSGVSGTITSKTNNPMIDVELFSPVKLAAASGNSVYSYETSSEEGEYIYTSGYKTESGFSAASGLFVGDMLGISGIGGWKQMNDMSVSAKNDLVTFKTCRFDSGYESVQGNVEYQYRKYTIDDDNKVKQLYEDNQMLEKLGLGVSGPLSSTEIKGILNSFEKLEGEIDYSDTRKNISNISWNPKLNIVLPGDKTTPKKTLFSMDIKLAMSRADETEVGNGYSVKGTSYQSSDSSSVINTIIQQEHHTNCDDIFNYALLGMAESIGDTVSGTVGTIKDTISNGMATIIGDVKSSLNWNITISGRKKTQKSSETESLSVLTAKISSVDDEADYVPAATVGDAYAVYVEDENGEEIKDLSEHPLTLALEYTQEDLDAAKVSKDYEEDLAIYRYDEENNVLCYVGGVVDSDNKTVTTNIDKSGEYVLVYDGASPEVTGIIVSDASANPVVRAQVKDLSAIREIRMTLDGKEIVSANNFEDYYNKRSGEFLYTVTDGLQKGEHTIAFEVTDSSGNKNTDAVYAFIVVDAPQISSVDIPDSVNLHDNNLIEISVAAKAFAGTEIENDIEIVSAQITELLSDGSRNSFEKELALDGDCWIGSIDIDEGAVQYNIQIKAKDSQGNWTSSDVYTCLIENTEVIQISDATVTDITNSTYTGNAIEPVPTVELNGTILERDTDYTVSYKNNKNVGTATVIITGIGNYTGTKTVTFNIIAKTGWQKENSYWYFYNEDGTKAVNTWKKDSKGWCWLQEDGAMLTNGWAKDSKGWCWIGDSGYMVEKTKWIKVDGSWFHITKGYRDQSKWMKDSKGWCYLGKDGKMVTNGWAKDSKGWCWMGSDGYWVSNKWIKSGGQWYYIKSNHYMAANEWAKDSGGWMYMDGSGKITKSKWVKSGGYWYYLKSNGYMATGTVKINGKTYKFDSAGRWIS